MKIFELANQVEKNGEKFYFDLVLCAEFEPTTSILQEQFPAEAHGSFHYSG